MRVAYLKKWLLHLNQLSVLRSWGIAMLLRSRPMRIVLVVTLEALVCQCSRSTMFPHVKTINIEPDELFADSSCSWCKVHQRSFPASRA